jgi:hypothetical protein
MHCRFGEQVGMCGFGDLQFNNSILNGAKIPVAEPGAIQPLKELSAFFRTRNHSPEIFVSLSGVVSFIFD